MKICWLWCELKLLLADIARSVRLNEEVTRVSQHFGALTIDSADALVKRDQQMLLSAGVCYGVVLIIWSGVVLKCFERLFLLVVAADFTKGNERFAADRLLLISSIDLGESAGEVEEGFWGVTSYLLVPLATAGLKPSADYDDVTDDVINAKPSADSSARPLALLIPDFYCSSSSSTFLPADFIDSVPDHIFACGLCYTLRNGPTSKTHSYAVSSSVFGQIPSFRPPKIRFTLFSPWSATVSASASSVVNPANICTLSRDISNTINSVLISWNDVVGCTVSFQQMKISADSLLKKFSSWFSLFVEDGDTTAFD
ncbi:pentatricopeptide repeat-containing protein mitochondrial-like [Dorcoceras hygrometricum]|uniref:Pentatricopeptide repeat-containing protein mitochondrial-like n=1 Tax=Dorcoceras hygrometricum TaxID=472368 RepID=A0A2Z7AQR4_9LAMI|nr:pentatricopeptide repeat-containing protein mitochondrial-like [Dorcoceras hygrometricum]